MNDWTLSCLSNNLSDVGVWTVTLRATLDNYVGVAAATTTLQVTVLHVCATSVISTQTLTPTPYQIDFTVTTAQTILSFTMHQDSAGIAAPNDMLCEIKTYTTDQPWLTVLAPADPLTGNFELQVTTNDYLLAGTYTVNLVIGFQRVDLTQTTTQQISVELIHPCKQTLLTTPQTIDDMSYMFGDAALITPFMPFDDSVAIQYGVAGLCNLLYSLELASDATNYGVTVDSVAPSISVLTTNNLLIG